jgi:aspartyl-tRNA(Asn)/glutamyl-tRNA(Gln) amidotransferase subunit A
MSSIDELCLESIAELGARIADRSITSSELTEGYLARIERLDNALSAFITVTAERARADARRADEELARGVSRGPLHGIPIALKDLYDTAGIRTTCHSRAFLDRVPDQDAEVVGRLREAGTVLLGKLAMHEFATGAPDLDGPFPVARNPWNTERQPGGSSSGSGAGVAAGLCAAALGSDTGGSIRWPATWCGIVGHKPTFGLVSRRGVVALSWSLDHVGPMARTVEDNAIMLQVLAGHDPEDAASARVPIPHYREALAATIEGVRVGVPWSHIEATRDRLHPEVLRSFESALDDLVDLGVTLSAVQLPYADVIAEVATHISTSEGFAFHEARLKEDPQKFGPGARNRFLQGALRSAADYIQALRARDVIRRATTELMHSVDIIALPTSPVPPTRFDDPAAYGPPTTYTRLANMTGQPSVSVPCGFTGDGLPIGLMLTGRAFEDDLVLRVAHHYERSHEWHTRRPVVS